MKNLCELRWDGGCRFARDRLNDLLKIYQKSAAGSLVNRLGVGADTVIPMPVRVKLEGFRQDKPVGTWSFHELI